MSAHIGVTQSQYRTPVLDLGLDSGSIPRRRGKCLNRFRGEGRTQRLGDVVWDRHVVFNRANLAIRTSESMGQWRTSETLYAYAPRVDKRKQEMCGDWWALLR